MAGRGPGPKTTGRRNRSVPTHGEFVELAPLKKRVLPPVDSTWPAATQELYESMADHPATGIWLPFEFALLTDTMRLHAEDSAKHASEIRQRMDKLGLTRAGLRDNRWTLPGKNTPVEAQTPAEVRRLKAV
jgi:hypothetical protein